jgi:polyisoprenoid-binding protein YceI
VKIFSMALVLLSFSSGLHAAVKVSVDTAKSNIEWVGEKITDNHKGTVPLKSGELEFEGNKLKGGTFEIDMEKIANKDLEGDWNTKLITHLKSADFFDTQKFPAATLKIKDVQFGKGGVYNIVGELTIKGITKTITFDAQNKEEKTSLKLISQIVFDRTDYGIKYNSAKFFDPKALADKLIKDKISINVTLVAPKAAVSETK